MLFEPLCIICFNHNYSRKYWQRTVIDKYFFYIIVVDSKKPTAAKHTFSSKVKKRSSPGLIPPGKDRCKYNL